MKSKEYKQRMEAEIKKEKPCLVTGKIYWDRVHNEAVEYRYKGQTGLAIVCEPGDSGGGMQSCWGIKPSNLEIITEEKLNETCTFTTYFNKLIT